MYKIKNFNGINGVYYIQIPYKTIIEAHRNMMDWSIIEVINYIALLITR